MTKRSRFEQAQRVAEDQRMRAVGTEWMARLSAGEVARFRSAVDEAHARPRPERPANMPPGTLPNPPRPGRQPKVAEPRTRSRY